MGTRSAVVAPLVAAHTPGTLPPTLLLQEHAALGNARLHPHDNTDSSVSPSLGVHLGTDSLAVVRAHRGAAADTLWREM